MELNDIKEKVKNFLQKYIKNVDINEDDDIFQTRLVNSLFAMQLVLFVEKEFNIKVGNQDLDLKNFSSINAIADFVERKKKSNEN
ncbi:carrier protein [Candidatus Magnetomorum sp. HK-1]|nr:carrier protein [Candidatus Magnetomorum sp. HK-1]